MLIFLPILIGFIIGESTKKSQRVKGFATALVFGAFFAWLSTYWLSLFHLQGSSVIYSDLIEYCTGVTTTRPLEAGVSSKRSVLPMLLPRLFYADLGVFDALAFSALCCSFAMGVLFFTWGSLLGGHRLGSLTVLLALVPAPMTFIGRMLTSYPEMSVFFMFGTVTTCWAILSKKPITMLLAGFGIAGILLADTRGIIWALPFALGLLIAAVSSGSLSMRIFRLILLFTPIIYSHTLASKVYVFNAIGIEQQADLRPMLYRWAKIYPPPWDYPSNFTWGMNPLSEFPKTIQFLLEQGKLAIPEHLISDQVLKGREIAKDYLLFAAIGGILALYQWRKQPWRLFALFITISPYLIGFNGALQMLEEHTRFYIQTLPGVIVLWAIAWQGLSVVGAGINPFKWTNKAFNHGIHATIVLILVLGIIPSILSPVADWRRDWNGTDSNFRDILSRYENGVMNRDPGQRFCKSAIDKNIREEKPLTVTLYDSNPAKWILTKWPIK